MQVRWALILVLITAGCEGVMAPVSLLRVIEVASSPGAPAPIDLSCEGLGDDGPVRIEAVANEFAEKVHPQMLNVTNGCVGCHAESAARQLTVTPNAADTFSRARAAGFFADGPGSLLSRLVSSDVAAMMPRAGAAWLEHDLKAVARIGCLVRAFEASGITAADEQFPSELLTPFTGVKRATYDNAFLNVVQLKGKVKAVFGDTWVRDGVDRWEQNIGLFGGVNFTTHFVEARAATPELLLGLDVLGPDVCGLATRNQTGPFTAVEVTGSLFDVPASRMQQFEAEALSTPSSDSPAGFSLCSTHCEFATELSLPTAGTYQVVVRAQATSTTAAHPSRAAVTLAGIASSSSLEFTNAAAVEDQTATIVVPSAGKTALTVAFSHDGSSATLSFDRFEVIGPLGRGTGTQREDAAKHSIDLLYQRMLFRPATVTEQAAAYSLLTDLTELGTVTDSWSGLCEALVHHPDFLFSLPPSAEAASGEHRERALLVSLTQSLLGRPPLGDELEILSRGGFEPAIDAVLQSEDFRSYYFSRIQLRIETRGTPESDEPARLWTWIAMNERPFSEVLTADFTVDVRYQQQARPAAHGRTGLLTMKGYLASKPGLPHFNYPARVMSAFMGSIFEVPPGVFELRGAATASSTVEPSSACYSCHRMLTPLAYQRQRWADDGTYRETDFEGAPIDDSDQALVDAYPFKGVGLEAFSTRAVLKEVFVRRMINTQFRLLMGRDLRHADDERELYRTLWNTAVSAHGNLKAILKAVAMSDTFQRRTTP